MTRRMDLEAILERLNAPEDLVAWVAILEEQDPWSRCARADWLIWLAACEAASIATLLSGACDCVQLAVQALPATVPHLADAVRIARQVAVQTEVSDDPGQAGLGMSQTADPSKPDPIAACLAAAQRCEQAAEHFPAAYRTAMSAGFSAAARAAAWVARAAEGLATANIRSETNRLDQGLQRAVTLGLSPQNVIPEPADPPILDPLADAGDPVQTELIYAVAATSQAIAEAVDALTPAKDDTTAVDDTHAAMLELLRRELEI